MAATTNNVRVCHYRHHNRLSFNTAKSLDGARCRYRLVLALCCFSRRFNFWIPGYFAFGSFFPGPAPVFLAIRKIAADEARYLKIIKMNQNGVPKNIVIFASGSGSNARQIIHYFENDFCGRVALVVCNKRGAGVANIAKEQNIPVLFIEKSRFFKGDAYLPELQQVQASLLVLAGFLWKIPQALLEAFPQRIINIHPALLPKFGGQGMYGSYVHQAVLSAGAVESGITVHFVDGHYDNGDVIFQTGCPVLPTDTPQTLAERIQQLEHLHYPRIIKSVLQNLQ